MRPLQFVSLVSTLLSTVLLGTLAFAQSVQGPHGAINFENVNVCPARQTSPKPCTRTSTLHYNVTTTTTFGATEVVTQGLPNLDFTMDATTCKGTLQPGSSCTVRAGFTPRAPGLRMGAVRLTDPDGNLLVSTYIYGVGQGPVAAFNPGPQKMLPVTGFDGGALTVDAAGNVYFTESGSIAKFDIQTGVQTTVATGVPRAYGLALDGAGNLFFSYNGIIKIAANTGVQTPVGQNLGASGLAVDGRGNLYAGIEGTGFGSQFDLYNRLVEVFAAGEQQEEILLGGDEYGLLGMPLLNYPAGVAVDAASNAYVACANYGPVYESIADTPPAGGGGVIANRQFEPVGETALPHSLAVDAAGDVFVTDGAIVTAGIYEVAVNDGTQTLLVNGPFQVPLALDAAGNFFFSGIEPTNTLTEAKDSRPAPLNFGKIAVGATSAPQSITIQNVGNQPLNAVPPGLTVGTDFQQVPALVCPQTAPAPSVWYRAQPAI